ncbi:MAG: AmmeMemoRadiSam system protein B [Pseudothermotoga sp.]
MKRSPIVAGSFYPSSAWRLKDAIEMSFKSSLGPGYVPNRPTEKLQKDLAIIVPHAGYIYSGPVAAHAYAEAAKFGKPELVVLVGPNHTGFGSQISLWAQGEWETPLGSAEIDKEAGEIFLSNCDEAAVDYEAHINEHSLEVQLPFLQHMFGEIKILPISIFPVLIKTCEKIAKGLDAIASNRSSVLFVFSTDLNHYESEEITKRKDQMAIEKIIAKDPVGLYTVVAKEKITMCGLSTIATLLFMKHFGKPRLLFHATSADVTKDKTQAVGYASFICEPT